MAQDNCPETVPVAKPSESPKKNSNHQLRQIHAITVVLNGSNDCTGSAATSSPLQPTSICLTATKWQPQQLLCYREVLSDSSSLSYSMQFKTLFKLNLSLMIQFLVF